MGKKLARQNVRKKVYVGAICFHTSFKEKIWLYIFSQKMHCIITVTKFCLNIVNLFFSYPKKSDYVYYSQ